MILNRTQTFVGLSLLAVVFFAAAGQADAATTSFQEGVSPTAGYTADAVYIRSLFGGGPDGNQNGDPDQELTIGTAAGAGEVERILLEFDVSAIPASDVIQSAELVLTIEERVDAATSATVNVYQYDFDFDETVATWNNPAPPGDLADGGTLGTLLTSDSFSVVANTDVTFGDTAAFRSAVSDALAGDGFVRLILAYPDESTPATNNWTRFHDETVGTEGFRPELVVSHVPEPTTLMLVATGGVLLVGLLPPHTVELGDVPNDDSKTVDSIANTSFCRIREGQSLFFCATIWTMVTCNGFAPSILPGTARTTVLADGRTGHFGVHGRQ